MRIIPRIVVSLLVLGVAVAASPAASPVASLPAQEAERYSLQGDAPAVFNLAGNVEIVAGDGSAVQIEVTRNGADASRLQVRTGEIDGRETLRVIYPADEIGYARMEGGRTSLRVRDDGTFGDGFGGGDRVTIEEDADLEAHADLRIVVPEGSRLTVHLGVGEMDVRQVRGDLSLDLSSGRITTRATRGSLSLDTGSGSVELTSVRGSTLLVDTGSGSVEGSGVEVDRLEVDTGSGGIRLDEVTATRASLDTGSGSVRLGLLSDVRELEIDTGSGSVTVTIPSNFGARLDLDSGSGGVRVGLPVKDLDSGRSYLRGTVGDGHGSVEIDTGSGSIRIDRSG